MRQIIESAATRAIGALLVFALLVGASLPVRAQEDAQRVFALSGLDSSFARGPDTAIALAHELGADGALIALWSESALRTFDPETMTARAEAIFARALPAEAVPALIAFRTSPLGQAVTAAEVQTNTLTAQEVAQRDATRADLEAQLSNSRQALNARLAALTNFPGVHAGVAGLVEALLAPVLAREEVERLLALLNDELAMDESEDPSVLFTYHPLSDAEIEAYIAHLESPEGRAYHAAMVAALEGALFESIDALGADFAARIAGR